MIFKHHKKQKIIALMICCVIALLMLFSSLYVIAEADHNCPGDNCAVCINIHRCEEMLKLISFALTSGSISVAVLRFSATSDSITKLYLFKPTPVDRKVRMNN